MLLPYVAPVVAVTFVWEIMLSPSSASSTLGADVLGWDEPIAVPHPADGTINIFGLESTSRSRCSP